MRVIIFLNVLVGFFLISCEKEPGISELKYGSLIDTTVISSDTFNYSFGYFGDEEGLSIISYPKNSKSCEILNKNWEERILCYIPLDNFVGTDSIIIVTMRGSDGASSSTEIDTILIVIKVLENDFQKKLIGKWNWTGSCGGFTGECWYPDEDNSKQIEFDNSMRFIEIVNNSVLRDCQYELLDSFMNGQSLVYKIRFINYYDTYLWFSECKLNIQGGDFVEEYNRIN